MESQNNQPSNPANQGRPQPQPVQPPVSSPAVGEPTMEPMPEPTMDLGSAFEGGGNVYSDLMSNIHAANSEDAPDFSNSASTNSIAATDPIIEREPPKAADPIEEALKAPIKPADPVPGSIGSAVSMPNGETAPVRHVAARRSAANIEINKDTIVNFFKSPKNQKRLFIGGISVVVLAGLVIAGIAFLPALFSNKPKPNSPQNNPVIPDSIRQLSCDVPFSQRELANISDAINAKRTMRAIYYDGALHQITIGITARYEDSEIARESRDAIRADYIKSFKQLGYSVDPFNSEYRVVAEDSRVEVEHLADASAIDEKNADLLDLTLSDDEHALSLEKIQTIYQNLGYDCVAMDVEDEEE